MNAEERQRRYYAATAEHYEHQHHAAPSEHDVAMAHVMALARQHGIGSILDVGAGTGRQVAALKAALPGVRVVGIEPVTELIAVGQREHGLGPDELQVGDARRLPFADSSFDFVTETGVLHHVPDPAAAIAEMMRVAKRGVFISDCNRFGQGSLPARLVKLGLWATRLWPVYYKARTRGRGYEESVGDGVFYSFSIFDHIGQLSRWADDLWVVPTTAPGKLDRRLRAWTGPLLGASHGLVCALKRPQHGA